MSTKFPEFDYSLVGANSKTALEKGLAEADWYACPVSREDMQSLLERKDWPAIRDTIVWFSLLGVSGYAGYLLWGSWLCVFPFMVYWVIYASTSDSRWHESSHGTAFKTDWLNDFLYEIASFMVMRESTVWRWSHTRHHSDTIIVGRDPEIAVPRPPDLKALAMSFFYLNAAPAYFKKLIMHAFGKMHTEEKTFIPESDFSRIYFKARISLLIYFAVIGYALYIGSWLPLMYVGLPNFLGSWLMPIYGYTQHAGLAENVLDHRLNCRTVYMNFIHRFLYWNMNYHVEHHMFPLVPYHALPRLHQLVKNDMPTPYTSIFNAWKEIIPAVLRQVKDPYYYVKRELPKRQHGAEHLDGTNTINAVGKADEEGWVEIGDLTLLAREDVLRFDYEDQTFAVYQNNQGHFYATDGVCTHGNTHLATGMVKGNLIECPKHNGRFDIADGSVQRKPVCVGLATYPVKVEGETLFLNIHANNALRPKHKVHHFTVQSNDNVATFIKELVLKPDEAFESLESQPGDYIQLNIPTYQKTVFSEFSIQEPYQSVWKKIGCMQNYAVNEKPTRRNYSIASNPHVENVLRFNVRIATPPRGQDCQAGVGSSYVFNLKPGDRVSAMGPMGDFHVKDTDKEMIYLGGGAGMAPLRAHISYLFETLKTGRKISFWYGARSLQETFYQDYFEALAEQFKNFSFHLALSEPLPEDNWTSHTGLIHDVLNEQYLKNHPDLSQVEFYLCGPPAMIQAGQQTLKIYSVSDEQIAFDEFS